MFRRTCSHFHFGYLLFLHPANSPTVVCTALHLRLSSSKEFHNRSISVLPQESQTFVHGLSFSKQLIDLFPSKRYTCSLSCVSRSPSSSCLVFLDTVKSDPVLDLILHLNWRTCFGPSRQTCSQHSLGVAYLTVVSPLILPLVAMEPFLLTRPSL